MAARVHLCICANVGPRQNKSLRGKTRPNISNDPCLQAFRKMGRKPEVHLFPADLTHQQCSHKGEMCLYSRRGNKIFRFFSLIDISSPSFSFPASFLLLKEDKQVLHLAQWSHNESDWNREYYSLLITNPFTPSMYQFLTPALHVMERKID